MGHFGTSTGQIVIPLRKILWQSLILFGLFVSAALRAEGPATMKPDGVWGEGGSYSRLFRSSQKVKVEGNVLSMEDFRLEGSDEPGVGLTLETKEGNILVQLGPRWFVLQNDLNFTRGEKVGIVGVTIRFENKPAMLAGEILRGQRRVIFRDVASGEPHWVGPRP